jgi:hypothetical protein
MKWWTALAAILLITIQVFSQVTPDVPKAWRLGDHPLQRATSVKATPISRPNDPPITWSQGYLALVLCSAQNDTILRWDADTVECPGVVHSPWFHPKNFGPEDVTICAPVEPESPDFARFTDCLCYNTLGAGQMSPCSVRVEFRPTADGTFNDTMRIQTDAANSYGGFVRIALSGTRVSQPESPNVVISVNRTNANLFWNSVHLTTGGCETSVSGYFVFYAPDNNGIYRLLTYTTDTTFVHDGVLLTDGGLFYEVVAGMQLGSDLRLLPHGATLDQVLSYLKK